MSNYIYLLREREFIKTGEPIFKVGMTTKENHVRFNQYPKGSILLFQIICKSCKNMETHILTEFRTKFKSRKDIGNEYFEGEYKTMMDIIYLIVKNEVDDKEINDKEININDEECDNLKVDEKQIETNDLEKETLEEFQLTEQIIIDDLRIEIINLYDNINKLKEDKEMEMVDDFEMEEIGVKCMADHIQSQKEQGYILNSIEPITGNLFELKIKYFEEEQRQREEDLEIKRENRDEIDKNIIIIGKEYDLKIMEKCLDLEIKEANLKHILMINNSVKLNELVKLQNTLKEKREYSKEIDLKKDLKQDLKELERKKALEIRKEDIQFKIQQLKEPFLDVSNDMQGWYQHSVYCKLKQTLEDELQEIKDELQEIENNLSANYNKQYRDLIKKMDLEKETKETEFINNLKINLQDTDIYDILEFEEKLKRRIEKENLKDASNMIDDELDLISSFKITTYENWIENTEIDKVIITNKKGEGFIKYKGQLCRILDDPNRLDFDENHMEILFEYIKLNQSSQKICFPKNPLKAELYPRLQLTHKYCNILYDKSGGPKFINPEEFLKLNIEEQTNYILVLNYKYKTFYMENDVAEIFQDTIKQCFTKNVDFYQLKYYEYAVNLTSGSECPSETCIFNALNFTFTPVDEIIHDKILIEGTGSTGGRHFRLKQSVNTNIVDEILNSLISHRTKLLYKQLMYRLVVSQEENQIIFYDNSSNHLLTSWVTDILDVLSNKRLYMYSKRYYDDAKEFKKDLKINKSRCIIIHGYEKNKCVKTQIQTFTKLGFKNIIVMIDDLDGDYIHDIDDGDLPKFEKYLQDNKEKLIECINLETNQKLTNWTYRYANDIFYDCRLFLTNFLKWCCVK